MKASPSIRTLLALALAACSSPRQAPPDDDAPAAEAAADIAPDLIEADAAPDVAPDRLLDAAPDVTPDAAPDAAPDVAPDAAPDVALDAGDAASDAPRDAVDVADAADAAEAGCTGPGQQVCGTRCVDTLSDAANCGACGMRCAGGGSPICQAGRCHLPVTSLFLGARHTCAGPMGGPAWCWGDNANGQVGDETTAPRSRPTLIAGVTWQSQVAAGGSSSCALVDTPSLFTPRCWGANDAGQLGDGTMMERRLPTATMLPRGSFIRLGWSHGCLKRDSDLAVVCWGANTFGQLGNSTRTASLAAVPVMGAESAPLNLTVGSFHSCLSQTTGAAWCWGHNGFGQLGDGTNADRAVATRVLRIADVNRIAAGGASVAAAGGENAAHTCAALGDDTVQCWGSNGFGQLGDGTTTSSNIAVPARVTFAISDVAAGGWHTCAIARADGRVFCWGRNDAGQLGDGTTTQRNTPVEVVGLRGVTAIAAGLRHTCAMFGGRVRCWGDNAVGQLGDGSTTPRSTPVDPLF
ncbi:MAG: hypothetical protein U0324_00230 [Polyangiales bacterium]